MMDSPMNASASASALSSNVQSSLDAHSYHSVLLRISSPSSFDPYPLLPVSMSSSRYSAVPRRQSVHHRPSNDDEPHYLPSGSPTLQEDFHLLRPSSPWICLVCVRLARIPFRAICWVPNPRRLHHLSVAQFGGRKRGTAVLCLAFVAVLSLAIALTKPFGMEGETWVTPFSSPATLVFKREDLQRIWRWEVASGHYPSRRRSMCSMRIFGR